MKAVPIILVVLLCAIHSDAGSITLASGRVESYIAITTHAAGVILVKQGKKTSHRWEDIRPLSLPDGIADEHRKRLVLLLKKAQDLLDKKMYIEASQMFEKADGHLEYLKATDLRTAWGMDADKKVRGYLKVGKRWLPRDTALHEMGYGLVKGKWLPPDRHQAYLEDKKVADAAQRERDAREAKYRKELEEARRRVQAQVTKLRKTAFADNESLALYFKFMLATPQEYGTATVRGTTRLGDAMVGVSSAWIRFTMYVNNSPHKTKIRFVKDFDGWEVDSTEVEFTSRLSRPSYGTFADFQWGKAYLSYLLYGR